MGSRGGGSGFTKVGQSQKKKDILEPQKYSHMYVVAVGNLLQGHEVMWSHCPSLERTAIRSTSHP